MKYQEFSTIYDALKTINSNNNLNQDNVIEAIKNQLLPNSDAYKEWKEGNFSLDHVFTTDGLQPQNTLLIRACESGDLKVVDLLLKAEASVNVAAGDKNPFTVAIENEWEGSKEDAKAIVDLLIGKVDAHVSAADENVNNTIVKAVERGNLRVFKALMEKGANVNIQVYGMPLLKCAEEHQSDSKIEEKDMEEIINTLKAPSKEKEQTDPEIATSTSTNNSKQEDEAESTIPDVTEVKEQENEASSRTSPNDAVSGNLSQEEYNEECAFRFQVEEITLSTGEQLPENNGINFTDAQNVTATPVNSSNTSTAPTTVNQAPVKNDTNFLSKHKGKIALSVGGLCVAGAIAAYVLAYPVVALVLAVSALAVLAYIGGVCEKSESPNTKSSDPVVSECCDNAELPNQ